MLFFYLNIFVKIYLQKKQKYFSQQKSIAKHKVERGILCLMRYFNLMLIFLFFYFLPRKFWTNGAVIQDCLLSKISFDNPAELTSDINIPNFLYY